MAQVGTNDGPGGNRRLYTGIAGVNDNDIVLETNDVSDLDTFTVMSAAGDFDVFVSLDGTTFNTAVALAIDDLGVAAVAPVLLGAPLRMYRFSGPYKIIRIRQNGSTACTGIDMLGKKTSR